MREDFVGAVGLAGSGASDSTRATRAPMRTTTNSSATTAACSAACRCSLSRRLSEGPATADTDCLYSQEDGCGRDEVIATLPRMRRNFADPDRTGTFRLGHGAH